jgi:hypothetical protein
MCHILSRLSIGVCSKIAISMCVDIFLMCYFSHFLLRYIDVLLFRQFFDYKLYSSLLLFKIYSKNHYLLYCPKALSLCVFIPNGFPYIYFALKRVDGDFLLYFIFFTENIDFLTIFYFIVLYLSYTFNTGTWWEQKMLRGLIWSRRNLDVNKQRRVLQFSEFVSP